MALQNYPDITLQVSQVQRQLKIALPIFPEKDCTTLDTFLPAEKRFKSPCKCVLWFESVDFY